MKNKQPHNTLAKTINCICIAIAVCCLGLLIYVTVSLTVKDSVSFFGYSLHVVVTDSMTPEINVGDLVVAKKTDKADIQVGDDIVFVSSDPRLKGNTLVHRVVAVNTDGSFSTSGIKQGASVDPYPATEIVGVVKKVSSSGGSFIEKLVDNKTAIFLLLILAACAVAVVEVFRIISVAHKAKAEDAARADVKEEIKKEILSEQAAKANDKINSSADCEDAELDPYCGEQTDGNTADGNDVETDDDNKAE